MPTSTNARTHGRFGVSDDAMPEVYTLRVNAASIVCDAAAVRRDRGGAVWASYAASADRRGTVARHATAAQSDLGDGEPGEHDRGHRPRDRLRRVGEVQLDGVGEGGGGAVAECVAGA